MDEKKATIQESLGISEKRYSDLREELGKHLLKGSNAACIESVSKERKLSILEKCFLTYLAGATYRQNDFRYVEDAFKKQNRMWKWMFIAFILLLIWQITRLLQ